MSAEKIPYLKYEFKTNFAIVKEWKLCEGAQGCTPVNIDGVCLRMDKSPPPLPGSVLIGSVVKPEPAKPTPTPKAPPAPKKGLADLLLWMATADERKAQAEVKKKEEQTIKPFDILDIPEAMAVMDFSIGKKFSSRWLHGRYFIAPTYKEEENGVVYPKDMIDTETIKLSWLFGFGDVESRYDELKDSLIYSSNAKDAIKKSLVRFLNKNPRFQGTLHTKSACNADVQQLHKYFQFQRKIVSDFDTLKQDSPTDLTASLGNFNFYAAIANAEITTDIYNRYNAPSGTLHCTKSRATITHIWIYAKDSYSFVDDSKASQYLGHWNKKRGLILVKVTGVGAFINRRFGSTIELDGGPLELMRAVTTGDFLEKNTYYSVHNSDYNNYRKKHNRGGDFVIYSDLKKVELDSPIFIDLEEVCFP